MSKVIFRSQDQIDGERKGWTCVLENVVKVVIFRDFKVPRATARSQHIMGRTSENLSKLKALEPPENEIRPRSFSRDGR